MRIREIQAAVLLCLILALPIRTPALPAFYFPPKPTATTATTVYASHNLHVRQASGTFISPTQAFPPITSINPSSSDPRTSTTDVTITTTTTSPTDFSTITSPTDFSTIASPTDFSATTTITDFSATTSPTDFSTIASPTDFSTIASPTDFSVPATSFTTDIPTTTPATDTPTIAPTTDIPSAAPTVDVTTTVPITGEPSTRFSPTLLSPVSTQPGQTTQPTPGTLTTSPSSSPSQTPSSTSLTSTTTSSGILSSTGISSVSATISGSETFVSVISGPSGTATATPGPEPPLTSGNSRTWITVGGVAAAVLFLALICFFVFQRGRQKREKRRLFNINGGLDSLTSINRASVGGDDQDGRDDDDDDLDSEKAFFMANPPARVRSPQSPHPDNHDLNIKTPLDQYEAQMFNWPTPIVVTDKHPQDHIRQHHLQRLLELQQEQLVKLNALVERYRVTYSRPQSPHSPVLSETRLSTRLSHFGVDDQLVFEDDEQLTSEEIRRLELKGDERLEDVPLEEGPFRDKGEIDDGDVELQRLEVSHHYHGPFADQYEQTSAPLINVFDDPNAVFEADFEVASIIIRSGSASLLSDSLELWDEREQRHYDKDKGIASSIRDSDSFLGLPLSTRASMDDLQAELGSYRDSNSTLAASSTVRERHFDITMDGSSTEYSGILGSSSGSGSGGGGGSSHGSGSGSGSGTITAVAAPKSDRPTGIQTAVSNLDRQREREQNEILLKAIEQVKAQYAEQYRQIHDDLANLQLE
ncbi:hypothetical protein EC957_006726 [Mortierella hygrophila]|uniref:Mid2 domain-containing protein n=1 Tax=Mortierella hygrophila TaxID=979708 RepID=A0A9P6JYV2_9FUNG|nr:hypothetical protein EC957_006726 [Mortierella hygrophila]